MVKQNLKGLWLVVLMGLLALLPKEAKSTAEEAMLKAKSSKVEVVFVLDTTGSMGGIIKAAKEKVWSITNTIASAKPTPEIKIGIIGYRDKGDVYVTKSAKMTEDLDAVYKFLMEFQAAGGGDAPESVNQALYEAVTQNEWDKSSSTYKVIFLVGDCPPHMDYQDVKYEESCKLAAKQGIIINTIYCSNGGCPDAIPIWQQIAKLAEGEFFTVSPSGDINNYTTSYDTEISRKSAELDSTRLYYGDKAVQAAGEMKKEEAKSIVAEAPVESVAERAAFGVSEAGRKNFLGTNELVDAVASGTVKIEDIKEEELPKPMQKMNKKEQIEYVKQQIDTRKTLTQEIKELSDKRQEEIAKQKEKSEGKDSFDTKISDCLKDQAKDKGIIFDDSKK